MHHRPLELTRRGWSLAGAAVGLVVASRLLGVVELLVMGVGALALVLGSLAWVRAQHPRLTLRREIHPARLHVDGEGRVDLVVTNANARSSPLLALDERFGDGRRAARFLLPALPPGREARAAYRVPTARRGCYDVGPLVSTLADPFGLAQRSVIVGPTDQVTIYPRVHAIAAPPLVGGHRRVAADSSRTRSVAPDGEELVALREYETGDDLRKVHWRATARTGELFIRQDEARREPQVVVVLDARSSRHDEVSFELAVEVVASVVSRLTRDGRRVEVRTTGGAVLCGAHDAALCMDRLSRIEPATGDHERGLTSVGTTDGAGDALVVVVTGAPDSLEYDRLVTRASRRSALIVVTTRAGELAAPDRPNPAGRASSDALRIDATRGFAAAWNGAVVTRSAAPPTPVIPA